MGSYYSGVINSDYDSELKHFGILGQKWGIRRFQNEDGTLTPAGRERYGKSEKEWKKIRNKGAEALHSFLNETEYLQNELYAQQHYDEKRVSKEFKDKTKKIIEDIDKQASKEILDKLRKFDEARATYQLLSFDKKDAKMNRKMAVEAYNDFSESVKDREGMISYYIKNEIMELPKEDRDYATAYVAPIIKDDLSRYINLPAYDHIY